MEVLKCLIIKSLFLQKLNNFSLLIITLIFITTHFHCTQKNETINLQEGDLLLQDLDSSPLCDAIEQVTNGFNNQSFSHIGIVLMLHDTLHVLEAFNRGVNIVTLDEFLNRSVNKDLKPKVLVGRVKKEYSYLIPKAIEHGIKLIGKEYDPEFKINNDTTAINIIGHQNNNINIYINNNIEDGDINLDNIVDILDIIIAINIVLNNYSPSELEILIADLNQDGNINIQDIILMIQTVLND